MTPTEEQNQNKLAIGWFPFTCSEDSTILFTELLNDHLDEWRKIIDFKHLNVLKSDNSIENLDVAFIEGAVSSDKQAERVRDIRGNSKYVVAIGSCAVTGIPSASRNEFTDEQTDEKIKWYMSHFDYSDKVTRLGEVIKIDDTVDGCPMDVSAFLTILTKYLKLFEVA